MDVVNLSLFEGTTWKPAMKDSVLMPGILHLGWSKGEREREIAVVHSASLAFEDS